MKKLLLLLCILLSMQAYSQIPDITVCAGTGINLTANAPVNTTFHLSQSDATANINAIGNPFNYTPASSMIIFARTDVNAVITITPFYVTVNPSPSVVIEQTLIVPPTHLYVTVSGGQPPYSYLWEVNGAPVGPAQFDGSIYIGNNPSGGQYQVVVIDSNGCMATNTIQVASWEYLSAYNDVMTVAASASQNITSAVSVLSNDLYFGTPANSPNNFPFLTLTEIDVPTGFLINPDGTVSVLAGTPAGTYNLQYSLCETNGTHCSNGIVTLNVVTEGFVLNAFLDSNGNGLQDLAEHNFTLGQFHYEVNNSGTITDVISSSGNCYIQESATTNSYNLSFSINSQYASQYTVTPASYNNVTFSGSGISVYNFPVAVIPYADIGVHVFNPYAPPRPGFIYQNNIVYSNLGNQVAAGTITFSNDNALAVTSTSEAGAVLNSTGFTFDFTDLQPGETRSISVFMQVPTIPTVTLGDAVANSASITNLPDELSFTNNMSTLVQHIVGSYDPNEKSESHGGKIVHSGFTSEDYLTYTIQFENTGTANAENVKVEDVLDAKLDETTIRMTGASHAYTLSRNGHALRWNFNGIDLPPSVEETNIGHGYLTFEVKPKPGYAVGDAIPNTADIYFDFNPAIVTNTCTTEFVTTLGVEDFAFDNFNYYPNPVKNVLVMSNDTAIQKVIITSLLGQKVLETAQNDLKAEIDLSAIPTGIYLVKVLSGSQQKQMKIVRQ